MKNLRDHDFEKINDAVSLSRQSKDKMKFAILQATTSKKMFLFPKLLTAFLTVFVIGLAYVLIFYPYNDHKLSQGEIIDSHTPVTLLYG